MTLVTDAMEQRDVVTLDVGGGFLLADCDDEVIIRVEGEVVKVLCDINNKYNGFVTKEKGREVLYMRLKGLVWDHEGDNIVVRDFCRVPEG